MSTMTTLLFRYDDNEMVYIHLRCCVLALTTLRRSLFILSFSLCASLECPHVPFLHYAVFFSLLRCGRKRVSLLIGYNRLENDSECSNVPKSTSFGLSGFFGWSFAILPNRLSTPTTSRSVHGRRLVLFFCTQHALLVYEGGCFGDEKGRLGRFATLEELLGSKISAIARYPLKFRRERGR